VGSRRGRCVAWRVDCDEEAEQPEEDGRDTEQAEGEPVGPTARDLRLLKNPRGTGRCTQARDDTPHGTLMTLPATLPTALARGSLAHAVAP
jgi:hypothetical protein